MQVKKIGIIGLGLIGGSLARALKERLAVNEIVAVDPCEESILEAIRDGNITQGFPEINTSILESDIIFLCTPVKRTLEYLNILTDRIRPSCILTDVCSTKGEILEYIDRLSAPPCFIGGHPMAGTEKTGYAASFSHLFENAYYILTPSKGTLPGTIEIMTDLIKSIGGIPVILDAAEHDKITAGISHIPHVIASALVNMVRAAETHDGKMQMLAAGGFKDITRIASSSPEMWENIVLSNKHQVLETLCDYIKIINDFKGFVEAGDAKSIHEFFSSAKAYRDLFPTGRKGLIHPEYEIIVDVVDKPGIIGDIATILGNNDINIKNINVSNSREFEQGCLKITLPDFSSVNRSFELLCKMGYKVYKPS